MPELSELSATDAASQIAQGRITSESLVRACLERIEQREEEVRAWVFLDPDRVIAVAKSRDASPPLGPLHGVPVGFKDIVETADCPTEYGSAIYAGHRPAADAACVSLVNRAGGIVMGKTVTTEFAFVCPNRTRNPHNLEHTPGGSSSGSAAAVADHMVPLAFGTQTGGSVIRPASFCGVVGYKPSIGQLSYAGIKLLARSLDTLGAMARRVEDMALLRAALLGAPAGVSRPEAPPTIGLCRTPWWERAEPASQNALLSAGDAFASAGANIVEVTLPDPFPGLSEANQTIMTFEGCRALADELARHPELLSDRLKERLLPAESTPYADYKAAVLLARQCASEFSSVLEDAHALLVPSAVGEAPQSLASTGDALFNRPWTTIGAPCVTLPGYVGETGLPVGIQLVGRIGEDEELLGIGAWAERELGRRLAN